MTTRAATLLVALLLTVAPLAADPDPEETAGFLPKDDLGVSAFQRANPECDGRGILVAVLDTGVDLLHPALQKTSDGMPKVVDFHDATDAGRIDTTTVWETGEEPPIGLSGRRLKLGDGLPSTIRLGLIRSDEIYPRRLLRRLRDKRKKERAEAKRLASDRAEDGKAPPQPRDPGDPVHDLVLYTLGDGYRVIIDTDGDGDLAEEERLREFPKAQETAVLGAETRLAVGVRVLHDGAAVSLLFDGGGHGTHVAGIIAGFFEPGSPLNGLAPGARILAVKIGNGRYGGPTTHMSLIRGLEVAGRLGADVVNISFGGPSLYGDGREEGARFVTDAVKKYGYAVCLSAGNSGPAHQTVGAPAVSRRAYAIGAWCSAATQRSNYGVVEPRGDTLFGFSSRGPLPSGGAGVDFIAPGAAVSSVPEWTLSGGQNMNGTSMAAPQAAGALAVLLSAARREKIPSTPNRLLTALRRGAKPVEGLTQVEQGYGLIQVGPALDELRALAKAPEPVEWVVSTNRPATRGNGYFETACVRDEPLVVELTIKPDYGDEATPERRARFSKILRLVPDAEWLSVASPVHSSSSGATIRARADPTRMKPGLNVGVIRLVDIWSGKEEGRAVVSVIRPRVVERCGVWVRERIPLVPGEARSLFFRVPPGATQVRIEARETAVENDSRISFRSFDVRSRERSVSEGSDSDTTGGVSIVHRAVREGTTLEVVFSRPFRTAPESSEIDASFCFRGLTAGVREVVVPHGRYATHVPLRAGGDVAGRVEAFVEWEAEPVALSWKSVRDPDGPLLLGKEAIFVHEGRATFDVAPNRPEHRVLFRYESPFEDYLDDSVYEVRDQNGRILKKGLVRFGSFTWKPPHRGRFEFVIRTWERGRRFHHGGGILSPLLLRKIKRKNLTVRHDIYDGIIPGGPSGGRFDLPDGSLSSVLVERPKGAARFIGTLRFKDSEWNVHFLERRLTVEPAPADRLKEELLARLAAEVRLALDRDGTPKGATDRISKWSTASRALGALGPRLEADLHRFRAHLNAKEAREALYKLLASTKAKGGEDHQAVLRALVEVEVLFGDIEKAKSLLAQVRGESEAAHRVRFLVANAEGDVKAALGHLDKLLKSAPPTRSLLRARFDLLVAAGKLDDAGDLIRSWTAKFPGAVTDRLEMVPVLEKARLAKK